MIDELEIKYDIKKLPFDYILLKWRLIINKQLYDEKIIDITEIHPLFLLEFSGNTIEKFESIFSVYDEDLNLGIARENLESYLSLLFKYYFEIIGVQIDVDYTALAKNIVNSFPKEDSNKIMLSELVSRFDFFKDEVDAAE